MAKPFNAVANSSVVDRMPQSPRDVLPLTHVPPFDREHPAPALMTHIEGGGDGDDNGGGVNGGGIGRGGRG